jgi:hypothetical protein
LKEKGSNEQKNTIVVDQWAYRIVQKNKNSYNRCQFDLYLDTDLHLTSLPQNYKS